MVGGSTDRSPRGIDLRRHVTCLGVDIQDDRRSRTFEGDHFKCSHGAMIEVTRHGWRGDVEPLFPGSCWRSVNARYGFRGVRVGEASHPGPRLLRRLRRGRSRGARAKISDEEVLARHSHRHVVPRIDGVASVADVTQTDVVDVEDHSAVAPTLLDSLAETFSTHQSSGRR